METSTTSQPSDTPGTQDSFDAYLDAIQKRVAALPDTTPLFVTDVDTERLFEAYLARVGDGNMQYHRCSTCKSFFRRFGGIVTIDPETGKRTSLFWDPLLARSYYRDAIGWVQDLVERGDIRDVFFTRERTWGTRETREPRLWTHYGFTPNAGRRWTRRALTDQQGIAAKKEDFRTVKRALGEWKEATLKTAVALLKSGQLPGAEKTLGAAEWLLRLSGTARKNDALLWLAVASAPEGFCHPRSGMLGMLCDNIESGKSGEEIVRAHGNAMRPDVYRRPTAPASDGAITAAEKLVEQLGIAPSLERRFATLDDVQVAVWRPKAPEKAEGVFGHLRPKAAKGPVTSLKTVNISIEKFLADVLPDALSIELHVPSHGNFYALTTALHEDAPPILQWDMEDQRNPVSWYTYTSGSLASQWNLSSDARAKVAAVVALPCHWHGKRSNYDARYFFLLENCKDTRRGAYGLFPECLKSELHGISRVVEQYSQKANLGAAPSNAAAGIVHTNATVTVHTALISTTYRIVV